MLPNCTLDDKQPIEKLFRQGSGNTCIHSLVEWKLDPCYQKDGFRFMTTGFCARKGRGTDDENQDGQEQTAAPTASVEYFNYCIFCIRSSISRLLPPPLARSYIVFWQLKRITKSSYTCVPKLYLTLLTLILLICGIASSIHKFGKSSSVIIKIILYKTSESVCRIISVLTLN